MSKRPPFTGGPSSSPRATRSEAAKRHKTLTSLSELGVSESKLLKILKKVQEQPDVLDIALTREICMQPMKICFRRSLMWYNCRWQMVVTSTGNVAVSVSSSMCSLLNAKHSATSCKNCVRSFHARLLTLGRSLSTLTKRSQEIHFVWITCENSLRFTFR